MESILYREFLKSDAKNVGQAIKTRKKTRFECSYFQREFRGNRWVTIFKKPLLIFHRIESYLHIARLSFCLMSSSVPQPTWFASLPTPVASPIDISARELKELMDDATLTPGKDYVVVDVRRTDLDVSLTFEKSLV